MDKNQVNTFQLGLNKDLHSKAYKEGHYTFALNAVNETKEGDLIAISSEIGNIVCAELQNIDNTGNFYEDMYPLGEINLGDSHILFLGNGEEKSEIGKLENCTYTRIKEDPCLNFKRQIQGTFRILNGCETVIYWVDGDNSDRAMNIDDMDKYSPNGVFDCNLIKLKPDTQSACVANIDILNSGGNLDHGMYQIILSYEDEDGNESHYFYHSPLVPIVEGNYSGRYESIAGGDVIGDAGLARRTNKAIRVDMTGLDENFKYVNIVVGFTQNGVSDYTKVARVPITSTTGSYLVSTLDTNEATTVDSADLVIITNPFVISDTITQHDSRLIRGNLKSKEVDWAAFQVLANDITVKWKSESVIADDSKDSSGSPKTSTYYTDYRSYMRDEIYSLGIVWIFDDGTESPVFHIPGRELNTSSTGAAMPDFRSDPNPYHQRITVSRPSGFSYYAADVLPTFTVGQDESWDSTLLIISQNSGLYYDYPDVVPYADFATPMGSGIYNFIPRWKVYNTATRTQISGTGEYGTFEGELAFWESDNRYPVIEKCDEEGVYIYPVESDGSGGMQGQKIRHHKMPDTNLDLHFATATVNNIENSYIKPLGLKLDNIAPPAAYAGEIQGYYIVREKRDDVNKTVFDKGIMYVNPYIKVSARDATGTSEESPCVDSDAPEYSFQTNVCNVHNFRANIIFDNSGADADKVGTPYSLTPKYAFFDNDDDTICTNLYRNKAGYFQFDRNGDNWAPNMVKSYLIYDKASQSFHFPKHKFGIGVEGSFIKNEKELYGELIHARVTNEDTSEGPADNLNSLYFAAGILENYNESIFTNRSLTTTGYVSIEPNEEIPQGLLKRNFTNRNQQKVLIGELEHEVENITCQEEENIVMGYQDPLDGDNIPALPGNRGGGLYGTNYPHALDAYNEGDKCSAQYISSKQVNFFMYGPIGINPYYRASKCIHDVNDSSVEIYGGDIFISQFSFFQSSLTELCGNSTDKGYSDPFESGNRAYGIFKGQIACDNYEGANNERQLNTLTKTLNTFFVESEVNTELRNIDFDDLTGFTNTFWPLFNGTERAFLEVQEVQETPGLDGESADNGVCEGIFGYWKTGCETYHKELFLYNDDYSAERSLKPFIPLEFDFEFCKPCQYDFPRRITYSEAGYQAERQDNYRVFLPLNYRDIPPNTGEITNLFVNFDKLYCHTPRSIYQIFTKAQELKSDQATLYIGTGEFFSIPPQELVTTDYGYAGSSQQWSTVTTEFGTVYIDDLTGRVMLLDQQLKDISASGLRNWFEENIPLEFVKQVPEFGDLDTNPTAFDPATPKGLGYSAVYDPRHKRVIFTKKDYKWRGVIPFSDPYNFTDQSLYEDRGWTISYSFLSQSWTSWHSYRPSFYFNDANTFYTVNGDNIIYKHNEGNYQTYYNMKRNFIVDFPVFNIMTQSPSSVMWVSDVRFYDETTRQYRYLNDVTFDQGYVYNEDQATYPFSITVKPEDNDYYNVQYNADDLMAKRTDNNWKVSGIRDYTINNTNTILTSEWANASFLTAFNNDNYIDHIINPSVVSSTKTQYELGDMKSKVNNVRLFFKPEENYKKILYLINTANDQYIR